MADLNKSPVIGILTIDINHKINEQFDNKYNSYIPMSYVKYLECSGARIIPIWIGKDEQYYRDILSIINGVFLPGGGIFLGDPVDGQCAYSVIKIFKIACAMNRNGIYLPIWGTCLGFQLILHAAVSQKDSENAKNSREISEKIKESLNLEFEKNFRSSRLFENISDDIVKILECEPVACHFHRYIVTKQILSKFELTNDWIITGVNRCNTDDEFISAIEHKTFPFYGVAFHPEKPQFDTDFSYVTCTNNAIKVSQYFSRFFVEECRKNLNEFSSEKYFNYSIYNFDMEFTSMDSKKWRQCFLFHDKSEYKPSSST